MTEENENDAQSKFEKGKIWGDWLISKYEGAKPKLSFAAKAIFFFTIGLFIFSFALELVGVATERNELVSLGRIAKAVVALIIMIIASVVAIVLKSIARKEVSIAWYLRFMIHCFLYQLIIAFALQASPIPITFSALLGLNFAIVLFSLGLALDNIPLRVVTTLILIISLIFVYYPRGRQELEKGVGKANEPKLVLMNHGDFPNGKVRCFIDGKAVIFYFHTTDNIYELFDSPGKHDIYQGKLLPITPAIIRLLMKNENLISPRNFGSGYVQNNPPEPAPAPAPPLENFTGITEPVPAPIPYDPPADSPPQIERKEFAVIAFNENFNPDRALGEGMVSWLGENRAMYAFDYTNNIHSQGNSIRYDGRIELAKVARKIVYAIYETRFTGTVGGLKNCSASINVRIIDADNGNILEEISREYPAKEVTIKDASRIALSFAFRAIENQFKKYM